MALAHCILGKFLGVVCHCFSQPLDVPTFAAIWRFLLHRKTKSLLHPTTLILLLGRKIPRIFKKYLISFNSYLHNPESEDSSQLSKSLHFTSPEWLKSQATLINPFLIPSSYLDRVSISSSLMLHYQNFVCVLHIPMQNVCCILCPIHLTLTSCTVEDDQFNLCWHWLVWSVLWFPSALPSEC